MGATVVLTRERTDRGDEISFFRTALDSQNGFKKKKKKTSQLESRRAEKLSILNQNCSQYLSLNGRTKFFVYRLEIYDKSDTYLKNSNSTSDKNLERKKDAAV